MATRTITFRVYCDLPGYGASTTWNNKIGPDLVVNYDSTKGLGSVLLLAVDDNPVVGAVYTVTAQSDAAPVLPPMPGRASMNLNKSPGLSAGCSVEDRAGAVAWLGPRTSGTGTGITGVAGTEGAGLSGAAGAGWGSGVCVVAITSRFVAFDGNGGIGEPSLALVCWGNALCAAARPLQPGRTIPSSSAAVNSIPRRTTLPLSP